MKADQARDARIVQSWRTNASSWTVAVRDGRIESRQQVTDAAIVDAVLSRSPHSVLDIGCGEGWLARELAARNIRTTGIDVVPELVEAARRAGGGDFHVGSYEELVAGKFEMQADVAVCNFSLLGRESVVSLVRAAPSFLGTNGSLIVQTLHPVMSCGDLPYRDGWREGSWTGFGPEFTDPAPWYFRTLESWTTLFTDCGLRLLEMREPLHPESRKPASVIFITESPR